MNILQNKKAILLILVNLFIPIKSDQCDVSQRILLTTLIADKNNQVNEKIISNMCGDNQRNRKTTERDVNETLISELADMDIQEYVTHFGYPLETHTVTTADNYILQLHRIPNGKNQIVNRNIERAVVFLQHGYLASSFAWLINGPEKALGFILADAGYDVWMGNSRGNTYSRQHIFLDPDLHYRYWDFSFHELGVYDLPASIDYILYNTGQKKIYFIAHSQGAAAYYIMLSQNPQYNEKIHIQFSLAPIAYVKNMFMPGATNLVQYFSSFYLLQAQYRQVQELSRDMPIFKSFNKSCTVKTTRKICLAKLFTLTGFNYPQFNESLLPILANKFPAGGSTKQFLHAMQEIQSGDFHQVDYGVQHNLRLYGTYWVPRYNLANIRAPIYIFYSQNDYLARTPDVLRLYSEIPRGNKHIWLIPDKYWNHIDFIFGMDAKTVIYDFIMQIIKNHMSP